MTIKILLSCTAVLAIATTASADSVGRYDATTGTTVTTRIPGSLESDEARGCVSPSFAPMPAPRGPCHTMVLTSSPVAAPVYSSFARMPDDRHPTVACAASFVPTPVAAVIEPTPVIRMAEAAPVQPRYTEPVRPTYVEPVRVEEPAPEELPHTASILPLVGFSKGREKSLSRWPRLRR